MMRIDLPNEMSSYDLEGSVDNIIGRLNELKVKHGPDIGIELCIENQYGQNSISVVVWRPETDEERELRETRRREEEKIIKDIRRKDYERLKKEFGE